MFSVGDVVVNFGLALGGRYATVIELRPEGSRSALRYKVRLHLNGHEFWTIGKFWRVVE